jgi:hypothetical protein
MPLAFANTNYAVSSTYSDITMEASSVTNFYGGVGSSNKTNQTFKYKGYGGQKLSWIAIGLAP